MENYILINVNTGKKLELTPEQVAALTAASAEPKRADPFERKIGSAYYCVTDCWEVVGTTDGGDVWDNRHFNTANYCLDEEMMCQRALHETLDRLLWRYSEQHGGDPEWDGENEHWSVVWDTEDSEITVARTKWCKDLTVFFESAAIAEGAIADVVKPFCVAHPEFVW